MLLQEWAIFANFVVKRPGKVRFPDVWWMSLRWLMEDGWCYSAPSEDGWWMMLFRPVGRWLMADVRWLMWLLWMMVDGKCLMLFHPVGRWMMDDGRWMMWLLWMMVDGKCLMLFHPVGRWMMEDGWCYFPSPGSSNFLHLCVNTFTSSSASAYMLLNWASVK